MDQIFPRSPKNDRALGRLLEEISWEGGQWKRLRDGGRTLENVLTAEVFQALDLLPRGEFLGEVLRRSTGADETRATLIEQIEDCNITVLPGNTYLRPGRSSYSQRIGVQPDVHIESPDIYAFVEAKRIVGDPAFQPEQLARQYVVATRDAASRLPFLLLVVSDPPPIKVRGQGLKQVSTAISDDLSVVLQKTEGVIASLDQLERMIDKTVAWTTWSSISEVTKDAASCFDSSPASVRCAIRRLASTIWKSIEWHS